MTDAVRTKLSLSLRGNERLRQSLKGRILGAEQRSKIGAFHKGRKRSLETRQKLSESHKKARQPLTPETKAKLSRALKASWARKKDMS